MLEVVVKGQDWILLVMVIGMGKIYMVFNIIWWLWKLGVKKWIFFLVDCNVLLMQIKNGDFVFFGNDIMYIIKNWCIDKFYQIYFVLYQGLMGKEEFMNVYKEFSCDFFDFVIIDECYWGSVVEALIWCQVLDYFD